MSTFQSNVAATKIRSFSAVGRSNTHAMRDCEALTEVQVLAQAKGVTLPTELAAKHKAMAAMLDNLSGGKFDKEYTNKARVHARALFLGAPDYDAMARRAR